MNNTRATVLDRSTLEMIHTYTVVLFLISISYVKPEQDILPIDPARVPILLDISKNCANKVGVDLNAAQKLVQWKFEDNEPENKLLYCFLTTSGYADENDKLNKDKFAQLVCDHKSKDEYLKVIDECNKLKGNDKYETSYKILNCFREKSPILFKL